MAWPQWAAAEYRDDEFDVLDGDKLGLIYVTNLCDLRQLSRAEGSGGSFTGETGETAIPGRTT